MGDDAEAVVARRIAEGRTLSEAQRMVAHRLAAAGVDTAGLDARLLVAAALGIDGLGVLRAPSRRLDAGAAERLGAMLARREAREPVSRILGRRWFHGLSLAITAATLDPRPETETLVDGVLELVRRGEAPGGAAPRLLDAGTGSGAVLLALLAGLPAATGLGIDVSEPALATATANASALGLDARARFQRSDWLAEVDGRFDLIVSNPPYLPGPAIGALEPEVRLFDPLIALDGGRDGLDAYRRLLPAAISRLADGGWLALEIGAGQMDAVVGMVRDLGGREVRVWRDLGGQPRCVAVRHQ